MRTMLDVVLAKKREHNFVPCLHYEFGGICRGWSFCKTCGFPLTEHEETEVRAVMPSERLAGATGMRGSHNHKEK